MSKSSLRIAVEIAREDSEKAIVDLERATVRERETRYKLNEALDKLEKGEKTNG